MERIIIEETLNGLGTAAYADYLAHAYRLLLPRLFQPLRAATLRGQPQRLSRGMRGKQFADDLSAWLSVFDVAKLRFLVEKG